MTGFDFPVIDLTATGANIRRLRISHKLSVRQVQDYFGFAEPRVIYKWQKGECLPTVDNLFALSKLFEVPMDQILVQVTANHATNKEQQAVACCSGFLNVLLRIVSVYRRESDQWPVTSGQHFESGRNCLNRYGLATGIPSSVFTSLNDTGH